MAYPTAINSQITDAITQTSVQNLGSASALSFGQFAQSTAHALSLAAHNATLGQQHLAILSQAVIAQGVALIYAGQRRLDV